MPRPASVTDLATVHDRGYPERLLLNLVERLPSCGRTRYQWLYLYGFVTPKTGDTFGALLPRVSAERMPEALAAFAADADPEGKKLLVVLVDSAGWHKAKAPVVPPNVVHHFLPPCTPELRPAEPLWPLVREAVANRSLGRIDRLRNVVRDRWDYLTKRPDEVQPRVGFHWAVGLER